VSSRHLQSIVKVQYLLPVPIRATDGGDRTTIVPVGGRTCTVRNTKVQSFYVLSNSTMRYYLYQTSLGLNSFQLECWLS
jgi:hypothetical protein